MTPIILCCGTTGRSVVYGRVETLPEAGQPVTLHGARMILRWRQRGLLGLASLGPVPGTDTRITGAVPRVCETVWREWIEVTPEAAAAIDAWASHGG